MRGTGSVFVETDRSFRGSVRKVAARRLFGETLELYALIVRFVANFQAVVATKGNADERD